MPWRDWLLRAVAGSPAQLQIMWAEVHAEVCARGFDARLGTFVQHYGFTELDASLLLLPLVGFLPADDPRVTATVDAVEESSPRTG